MALISPQIRFEALQTLDDFEVFARLRNENYPHDPVTGAFIKDMDDKDVSPGFKQRALVFADQELIGRTHLTEEKGENGAYGWWNFGLAAHEHWSRFGRGVVEQVIQIAKENKLRLIQIALESPELEKIALIEKQGFELHQTNPITCCRVQEVDFSEFPDPDATAKAVGVEIVEVHDRVAAGDLDLARKYHDMVNEALKDVPLPEPYVPVPFEEFYGFMVTEAWKSGYRVLAMDGERPVGMAEININLVNPKVATTALTGVSRTHRRKGIARALKLKTMMAAKARGIEEVYTDNEENNPMLELNYQLGYKKVRDLLLYMKHL